VTRTDAGQGMAELQLLQLLLRTELERHEAESGADAPAGETGDRDRDATRTLIRRLIQHHFILGRDY